ncbi:hypothetical protein V8E54_011849 [Elaphomyces granulatus]
MLPAICNSVIPTIFAWDFEPCGTLSREYSVRQMRLWSRLCVLEVRYQHARADHSTPRSPVYVSCIPFISAKKPLSIFPGSPSRLWPTICMEVGYSESYQELLTDADLLLEGSAGEIRRVILIKIEPLSRNASQILGFVEVWKYDESTGRKKIVDERRVLFPRPDNGALQRISFSWDDLFAEMKPECLVGTSPRPVPLKPEELRELLEKALEWIIRKGLVSQAYFACDTNEELSAYDVFFLTGPPSSLPHSDWRFVSTS